MLMTMRAGSFSTLVLLSLGVLLVLGSVPAGAQVMTAGGDLDVYDDNGGIVGRLVGIQSSRHWVISVEAPDGDVAALRYLSPAPLWGDIEQLVGFDAPNCNGNAYLIGLRGDGARTAAGYTYAAMYLGVYKVDLNTAASVTVVSSVLDNYGVCSNECLSSDGFPCQPQLVHPAEFVATISTAFPFHVRAATSSPSAVPSGVVGVVAGVLGISGALLVRLRRS